MADEGWRVSVSRACGGMQVLPGTELVVSYVLDKARDRLRARFPAPSARLERAGWEMLDETVSALEDAFRHIEAREGSERAGSGAKLESRLDDREVAGVVMRVFPEVVAATTAERRRMLAHALAGLLQSELPPEARSRVSRAVVQLEPSDVRELRKLDEAHRAGGGHPATMMSPELEPLLASGCVLSLPPGAGTAAQAVTLTALGRAVLAALAHWAAT